MGNSPMAPNWAIGLKVLEFFIDFVAIHHGRAWKPSSRILLYHKVRSFSDIQLPSMLMVCNLGCIYSNISG